MVLLNNKWNIFCRGLLLFSYCLTPLNKNRSFASSVPMCMYFAFGRVKTKDWLCFNFQILFDLSVFCSLTERISLQIGLWPARCQARNKWELSGSDWVFPLICFISTGPPRVVLWPPGFTVIHYILSVVIYWEKFSISNNRASDKPHWLRYCHCAKLICSIGNFAC